MRVSVERCPAGPRAAWLLIALPCALSSCFERGESRDPLRIPWEMARHVEAWQKEPADAGVAESAEPPVPGAPSTAEIPLSAQATAASCLLAGCHAEMADSERLHVRVAAATCSMCHVPVGRVADHRFDLAADDGGVCRTCHPAGEPKASAHPPYREAKCATCHDPHGGGHRALLRDVKEAALCARCHEPTQGTVLHGPYAAEECSSCHEPHQSEFKALARAESADLCLGCHDRPIESARGGRLIANIAALLESSSFRHGPIREGECGGCHQAHASDHSNLLRQSFPPDFYQDYDATHYALCFQCHSSQLVLEERTTSVTNFRDGDRNLHYLHVHREKGRSCRACHEVHASDLPFHMRASVPFGEWELPVDYRQTATGGTCRSGCHKEIGHGYSRSAGGS